VYEIILHVIAPEEFCLSRAIQMFALLLCYSETINAHNANK